jgi:hypothetical protein
MSTLQDFLAHPVETLERALHIRRQIDQLNEALKELFGPTSISLGAMQMSIGEPAAARRKGRGKMSAQARQRIASAQRARWARQKGSHGPETAIALERAKLTKKKRRGGGGLSAEGRAKIIAAQKKRWSKAKGGKPSPVAAPASTPARKKKRHLSPEARARIVAAVKARWARQKKRKS